jgi:4-diphosphocytidyl-2-C-methyl-D-erythritol kinase
MIIHSPAKINLFLHITGKRPDGFHNLFTLMCAITLYDTVELKFGRPGISIRCNDPKVPENDSNLACQAADRFFRKLNKNEGVSIAIDKNIPVAAGIGGGSSNAAAVLQGLNRYFDIPFSLSELMSLGLSVGADVPFFIFQKPAVATGIGELLESYAGLKPLKVLLVYPGFSVSTAQVYKKFNLRLTKCKKKFSVFAFKNKDFNARKHLYNDLETVTVKQHPEILGIKEALLEQGAEGALMSGSGPTVFGLFFDSDKAQKAKKVLSQNQNWKLFLADMII